MSYATQAAQYHALTVRPASPGPLVVMPYDHLLLRPRRSPLAAARGDDELRTTSPHRVLATLPRPREALVVGVVASAGEAA